MLVPRRAARVQEVDEAQSETLIEEVETCRVREKLTPEPRLLKSLSLTRDSREPEEKKGGSEGKDMEND